MDDFISRAEAVALAMQYCPDDDGVCSKAGHDLRELVDDLENAPPADVRSVVYCKDCIHWKTYPSPTGDKKYCSVFDWINSSTGMDYCSFAEKRQEDMREATEGQSKEET